MSPRSATAAEKRQPPAADTEQHKQVVAKTDVTRSGFIWVFWLWLCWILFSSLELVTVDSKHTQGRAKTWTFSFFVWLCLRRHSCSECSDCIVSNGTVALAAIFTINKWSEGVWFWISEGTVREYDCYANMAIVGVKETEKEKILSWICFFPLHFRILLWISIFKQLQFSSYLEM